MDSPVVEGSVKSGATFPITGSSAVAIVPPGERTSLGPPEARPGPRSKEPGVHVAAVITAGFLSLPLRHRLHRECLVEILLDDLPIEILEERLDVLGARAAVVDPVRVLVHVH